MSELPMLVVDYDPAVHVRFVRDSWAKGAREPRQAFERLRDQGRCLVAVLRGREDKFLGWALRAETALAFAYVKPVLRRRGIATGLLHALGFAWPVERIPLLYWTPSAERIAAAGKPIYYAPPREETACA